ncbi:uncharacterized protein LOC126267738 [Schistocerca gregaria]|uniref:uncharacterized protein LOC126267738 n=1 Tax=Schistocerca gregaria TaxID=7010 RepID=UPI00211E8591|nr:uncharacterized protein LOC126267738 [Schistocerca gregaria]
MEKKKQKGTKKKPAMIIDYNQSKSFIDISGQMKLYSHCLRRGVKWYRKLAVELLKGSALVNAHVIYRYMNNKKISITKFKEEVSLRLLHTEDVDEPDTSLAKATMLPADCALVNMGAARHRCTVCYEKMKNEFG